ncbi:hypothetical protein, partial [Bradyrhizobium sp. SZCCHNRI20481]|uniref:hypothetical protein n=1 Tax=Bradyrhizobium sp. SZCCHNRI20481 TaxID=3057286 RepID=UPI002916F7BB
VELSAAIELFVSKVKGDFGTDRSLANSGEKLGGATQRVQDLRLGVRVDRSIVLRRRISEPWPMRSAAAAGMKSWSFPSGDHSGQTVLLLPTSASCAGLSISAPYRSSQKPGA